MAALNIGVRLAVLALNAYLLYWWFKRDRRLDDVAWTVRIVAIFVGVLIFAIGLHIGNYKNQESVLRYVILPAALLVVVFVFFADASFFLARGLRRSADCSRSIAHVQPKSDRVDQLSFYIRAAGIAIGLALCFSALHFGNSQNQVGLNRFVLMPGAAVAIVFTFVPNMPRYLSLIVRHWLGHM